MLSGSTFGRSVADRGTVRGPDLLTVGEPLISMTAARGRLMTARSLAKSIGGAEANVAIGLARLGMRARYIGSLGTDPFGDEIERTLRGEDVDVSGIVRSATRPTGIMIKEMRAADVVNVFYYRNDSAASELGTHLIAAGEAKPRHVHVTGITLALGQGPSATVHHLVDRACAWGVPVSFDPNFRLKLTTLDEAVRASKAILPFVTTVLLSEAEAMAITGAATVDLASKALAGEVETVVVRRGPLGAQGTDPDHAQVDVPVYEAGPLVDSVGAGDAFTAGYLFEQLRGGGFVDALRTGAWTAGHVIAHEGDFEGLPFLADYNAWRSGASVTQR